MRVVVLHVKGVGLLECARRLQLALNTVKRYARADPSERMLRVPKYRASLVDPYREHLRRRRAEDPAVPVQHLFEEINALGFTGCLNLLHKYINQGRADAERSHFSHRWLARMLLTRPDNLKAEHRDLLAWLSAACPEMAQLAVIIRSFAELLTPCAGNADGLSRWIVEVRSADLPHLHAFARLAATAGGGRIDQMWVSAALAPCIVDYGLIHHGASDHPAVWVRLDLAQARTDDVWTYV